MASENAAVKRKSLIGRVLDGKMEKSVVVAVETLKKHPLYGKYVKRRVKFLAHDEKNECGAGDKVLISETRPLSGNKRWRVKEVMEKAK